MTDLIKLIGIETYGYHGFYDHERATGQNFIIDAILETDVSTAGYRDDLSRTINYAEVADTIVGRVAGEPVSLIETLAEEIAELILERFAPEAVEVTVHKPEAPIKPKFQDIAITIRREYNKLSTSTDAVPESLEEKYKTGAVEITNEVILALGSNLGRSKETLQDAVKELAEPSFMKLARVSPIVISEAIGGPQQPPYLNLVAEFKTSLEPEDLLEFIHEIENLHGRIREVRWGARTLDIDIIRYDDVTMDTDELTLPHPRAHERAFVLYPWYLMDSKAEFVEGVAVADIMLDSIGIDEIEVYRGE
ncbi:MAG: 2-amino-4-hydroxy-6-hydroxymethyldihydropteridine diphosphokinase [Micrococcaceae bacterium]